MVYKSRHNFPTDQTMSNLFSEKYFRCSFLYCIIVIRNVNLLFTKSPIYTACVLELTVFTIGAICLIFYYLLNALSSGYTSINQIRHKFSAIVSTSDCTNSDYTLIDCALYILFIRQTYLHIQIHTRSNGQIRPFFTIVMSGLHRYSFILQVAFVTD